MAMSFILEHWLVVKLNLYNFQYFIKIRMVICSISCSVPYHLPDFIFNFFCSVFFFWLLCVICSSLI
jgi:hypothetical protein